MRTNTYPGIEEDGLMARTSGLEWQGGLKDEELEFLRMKRTPVAKL